MEQDNENTATIINVLMGSSWRTILQEVTVKRRNPWGYDSREVMPLDISFNTLKINWDLVIDSV